MNKEYLASLDTIRTILAKTGLISLKEFFETMPELSEGTFMYQPADYKFTKYTVTLNQLTIDFLENISNKKFTELSGFGYDHTCFDLRKFFDKEGIFVVANISYDEYEQAGGVLYVVKDDNPLQFPTTVNTITLIEVSKLDESFVTYVNHKIEEGEMLYLMGMLV